MESNEEFFDELEKKSGVSIPIEQRTAIRQRLSEIVNYIPKVGVFGKTGVGKSSLCNALFGQDVCPVSDLEACTRNPKEVFLSMGGKDKEGKDKGIMLLDAPGISESVARREEYGKLYNSLLPELDLVLWILKGDDRAYEPDEEFYKKVIQPHIEKGKLPFFFILNQVDKIEPSREWNEQEHKPGIKQLSNIEKKREIVARDFNYPKNRIIAISANEKYNLVDLVDAIAYELPKEKRLGFVREMPQELHSSALDKWLKESWAANVEDTVLTVTGNEILAKVLKMGTALVEMAFKTVPMIVNGAINIFKKAIV